MSYVRKVIGRNTYANHDGAFVVGDSSDTSIGSANADEARFQMPLYAEAFNSLSARADKTAVDPVDPVAVLDGLRSIEVSTWEWRDRDTGTHMGPMAEDFHETFGLGDDSERIATVDADGVLFAAVQGLTAELQDRDRRIEEQQAQLDSQQDDLETQAAYIERLERREDDLNVRLSVLEDGISSADRSPVDD